MRFFVSKRLPLGLRAGVVFGPPRVAARRSTRLPVRFSTIVNAVGATCIYVISGKNGHCKIGYTTDPEARLAALQTGSGLPLKIEYTLITDIDPRVVEAEAHRILDKHRLAGEWFDVPPRVAIDAVEQASTNLGAGPLVKTDSEKLLSLPSQHAAGSAAWPIVRNVLFFFAALALIVIWLMHEFPYRPGQ